MEKEFTTTLSTDQIKKKLLLLHEHENNFNKEIGSIDKQIKYLNSRKVILARRVSKNVIYRNNLINHL